MSYRLLCLACLTIVAVGVSVGVDAIRTACNSEIFCHGPILEAVQEMEIFPDSKTFVDMSLKSSPATVLEAFSNLTVANSGFLTRADIELFLQKYFNPPNTEFDKWIPDDWTPNPPVLSGIQDTDFHGWAETLNAYWKTLGRKVKEDVGIYQDRHSILYLPNPFIIPGERFREFYYWDSYWIINGLLLSGMKNTARGMIENFLHVVEKYGIVPNGGRIYYTRRSQPPFLTPIMESYYLATRDSEFLRRSLPLLEKEYNFWQTQRTVTVMKFGKVHHMARYDVKLDTPRPEGFREDVLITQAATPDEASRMYGDLASACESGWDFSSRWFADEGPERFKLNSVRTSQILPVDLNAILWWNEKILADFHTILGNHERALMYTQLAKERSDSIYQLMWNDQSGSWFDYDLEKGEQRQYFYPSNMVPLFTGCYDKNNASQMRRIEQRVFRYLKGEGIFDYTGGVPTSKLPTNQQWDGVNSWSPLVHMLIEGLASTSSRESQQVAEQLAHKWLTSNWLAWKSTGHMFEKYKADKLGHAGGGGEYQVQVGFGWTNGVILILLNKYGHTARSPISNQQECSTAAAIVNTDKVVEQSNDSVVFGAASATSIEQTRNYQISRTLFSLLVVLVSYFFLSKYSMKSPVRNVWQTAMNLR